MKLKVITILIVLFGMMTSFAHAYEDDFYTLDSTLRFTTENEFTNVPEAFSPLVLGSNEIVYNNTTAQIDTINPSYTASYYPGGRGPNKLVIYTPAYGFHTGTNEFGTEAIVEGNTVVALSGADSSIPQNGIVISGHGSAKNWISNNITVGSKIYVDQYNNTITVYTTSDSYTYEAKDKIKDAQNIIDYYKLNMPNYNSFNSLSHIQSAQNYLKLAESSINNSTVLKQYSKEAIEEANKAIKTAMPYVNNELKGVWIRPTETSESQIIATLDDMKANGFNNIFIETYYHGKTIFPSETMNKYGFTVQNKNFEGFDPLKIWIREAHKRGIKIHTWFQSFYVGNQPPEFDESSILSVHPDWGNKTKQYADNIGATKSVSEHNGYFLDPANPYVQGFLEDLINEIITEYHPDGINLDYIRYPNSNSRNDAGAWGFTEYARNEFFERYEVDPIELTVSDAQWYDWNQYRRDKITNFVEKIGRICRNNNVYISAVVFPDITSALSSKQQDWRTWSYNDYIDGFTPLFLTYDSNMLSSMMKDVLSIKSSKTDLYAGLFVTFMGGPSEDLIKQIFETRKMGVNGVILFDYAHTTPVYTSSLMEGAFNPNIKEPERKIAQSVKKKSEDISQKKQEDKSKRKTIIKTSSKGTWIFTK